MISKQLTVYAQNKEVYVCMFRQKMYDKIFSNLLSKLLNPLADAMNKVGGSDNSKQDETTTRRFN
jgi:hypothetical protein